MKPSVSQGLRISSAVLGLVSQGCGHPLPGVSGRATSKMACSVTVDRAQTGTVSAQSEWLNPEGKEEATRVFDDQVTYHQLLLHLFGRRVCPVPGKNGQPRQWDPWGRQTTVALYVSGCLTACPVLLGLEINNSVD